MIEIWKDIKGYEGLYMVSNFGNVKSLPRNRVDKNGIIYPVQGKILSNSCQNKGYLRVFLCKNNTPKTTSVHRIVASAFIPNPENKPHVNHIDGNRSNNHYSNLEWCTSAENNWHMLNVLKRKIGKARFGKDNPAAKAVICIETNERFNTAVEASFKLRVPSEKIGMVCKGNRKRTGGLTFKYA